jgi:hypothetical protein
MSGLPVFRFHTKTIQSILDPVAAQVNKNESEMGYWVKVFLR